MLSIFLSRTNLRYHSKGSYLLGTKYIISGCRLFTEESSHMRVSTVAGEKLRRGLIFVSRNKKCLNNSFLKNPIRCLEIVVV